ncbi:hypothetical protein Tco_0276440 [Tanacetum coccineum]
MMVENKCYDELMINNHWMDKWLKEVLMIDYLSIVKTDKVNYAVETDMVKLVVEIESFSMSADELDKETGSSDRLQPKQADLSYVHALNEPHLHEIHVVPSKHEADQCTMFLNMDQLEKQLDNKEFQEIGSMDSFKVLKTQFQMFIKSRIYLDDEYVMQTTEEKVDTSKALDASLVDTKRKSRQQHTEQPEFNAEGEVDQYAEQCHDTCHLPAKLIDNQTTELSY